jgi:peptidoglycan/xylan/chitin deacetylase (PgdA/CDA1 family)
LSSVSECRYGIARGLPRILAVLDAFAARATFYVPGVIARSDPGVVRELIAAGHEVAHHGHEHLPTHTLDEAGERGELERGLAALQDLGIRPLGYRSPAWELTPTTLRLLHEHDFAYDSSLMGDDRPYPLTDRLLELPVHWSLDDVPYFAYHPTSGGRPTHPDTVLSIWRAEHDHAKAEDRHLTYTMHPDITGRPHRITLLQRLLDHLHTHHTPITTHEQTSKAA